MRPLKLLRLYLALGWTYVGLIIWLSLVSLPEGGPSIPYLDKAGHLAAYALMMAWFGQLIMEERARLARALGFIALGAGLELLQGLGGLRQMELWDAAANGAGVLLGLWVSSGSRSTLLERLENQRR